MPPDQKELAFAKIAKIVGMLSSTEGEALAALNRMKAVMAGQNIGWSDLKNRISSGPPKHNGSTYEEPRRKAREETFQEEEIDPRTGRPKSAWKVKIEKDREFVAKIWPHRGELNDWGHEFVENLHEWVNEHNRTLTDKQRAKLFELLDQLNL
jgi:hypothetical protein